MDQAVAPIYKLLCRSKNKPITVEESIFDPVQKTTVTVLSVYPDPVIYLEKKCTNYVNPFTPWEKRSYISLDEASNICGQLAPIYSVSSLDLASRYKNKFNNNLTKI